VVMVVIYKYNFSLTMYTTLILLPVRKRVSVSLCFSNRSCVISASFCFLVHSGTLIGCSNGLGRNVLFYLSLEIKFSLQGIMISFCGTMFIYVGIPSIICLMNLILIKILLSKFEEDRNHICVFLMCSHTPSFCHKPCGFCNL